MSLVGISIKLERIDEGLLYQDPGGGWWLSAVCTLDTDQKGRTVVAPRNAPANAGSSSEAPVDGDAVPRREPSTTPAIPARNDDVTNAAIMQARCCAIRRLRMNT